MKAFKITIISLVILGLIFMIGGIIIGRTKASQPTERNNSEFSNEQRVFDEADILSEEEEQELEAYIQEKQAEVHQDIVLLLIDDLSVQNPQLLQEYAEQWFIDHNVGWDKPMGDGVLYVDNWAEGADKKYTRMVTHGKAKEELSQGEIDDIIDDTCDNVNNDPYGSYKIFVKETAKDVKGGIHIPFFLAPIAALISALAFLFVQISSNDGVDTTSVDTYAKEGSFQEKVNRDLFIRSYITERVIERDHDSGGGGDFGGGGGSH